MSQHDGTTLTWLLSKSASPSVIPQSKRRWGAGGGPKLGLAMSDPVGPGVADFSSTIWRTHQPNLPRFAQSWSRAVWPLRILLATGGCEVQVIGVDRPRPVTP